MKILNKIEGNILSAEEMRNVQGGKRIFTCTEYELRPCLMFLTCNLEYQDCIDDVYVSCPSNYNSKKLESSVNTNLINPFVLK
ncbi:MAG: hypothetical protein ACI3ZX_04170 [Candidatus Aphodosoma sp.]